MIKILFHIKGFFKFYFYKKECLSLFLFSILQILVFRRYLDSFSVAFVMVCLFSFVWVFIPHLKEIFAPNKIKSTVGRFFSVLFIVFSYILATCLLYFTYEFGKFLFEDLTPVAEQLNIKLTEINFRIAITTFCLSVLVFTCCLLTAIYLSKWEHTLKNNNETKFKPFMFTT